jgi:hypothetical protein
MEAVKFAVSVPETHADAVRQALGEAGAGRVGDYKFTSFSIKGIGRFIPMDGAHPSIGEVSKLEEVVEEKIETVCYRRDLDRMIAAVKKVHPYEQIAFDVSPLLLDPHKITYRDNR